MGAWGKRLADTQVNSAVSWLKTKRGMIALCRCACGAFYATRDGVGRCNRCGPRSKSNAPLTPN